MAVPKRRKSHSRKRLKHVSLKVKLNNLLECGKCKRFFLSHAVCKCRV